jgi:transcriptional regulator with AAA-type ATPase domain
MKTTQVQPLPLQPVINGELQHYEQAVLECADWLSFHRVWGQLSQQVINAIAQSLQILRVEANTEIYRQDLKPVGLYLLKWGSVEIYRQSLVGKTHMTYRNAGDIFGYVPLVDQQADATYHAGAVALSKSEIWFLGRDDFVQLQRNHPEIKGIINHFLAQDLTNFAQRIAKEQARIQGLQSYIQPVPIGESIIGESKASQKLQQQVKQAAADFKPVILQAPHGSGKTFIAGLIHAHSGLHNRPFAEIDCAQLPRDEGGLINTDNIFGKAEQTGVIELLERGTLLIDNVQLLQKKERDRLIDYLKTGKLQTKVENSPDSSISSWVRLILASPSKITLTDVEAYEIKLFSLPQRKQDIPDFAAYFLNKFCRERGRTLLKLNQAGIRRLISYDYPADTVVQVYLP